MPKGRRKRRHGNTEIIMPKKIKMLYTPKIFFLIMHTIKTKKREQFDIIYTKKRII